MQRNIEHGRIGRIQVLARILGATVFPGRTIIFSGH